MITCATLCCKASHVRALLSARLKCCETLKLFAFKRTPYALKRTVIVGKSRHT
jgi:hypothetical protein